MTAVKRSRLPAARQDILTAVEGHRHAMSVSRETSKALKHSRPGGRGPVETAHRRTSHRMEGGYTSKVFLPASVDRHLPFTSPSMLVGCTLVVGNDHYIIVEGLDQTTETFRRLGTQITRRSSQTISRHSSLLGQAH